MGRAGSDIARLLAQSEVDGFEYRDFASAFDIRLEEKLKEMQVANEVTLSSAYPSPPVLESRKAGAAERPAVQGQTDHRPIDALFQRLSQGGAATEPLPALFARLR